MYLIMSYTANNTVSFGTSAVILLFSTLHIRAGEFILSVFFGRWGNGSYIVSTQHSSFDKAFVGCTGVLFNIKQDMFEHKALDAQVIFYMQQDVYNIVINACL